MDIAVELPSGCRLSVEQNPSSADRLTIDEALGDYNAAFLQDNRYDYFGLIVRDENDAMRSGPG
jgi:hypothetical protein